jgi:predicted permease
VIEQRLPRIATLVLRALVPIPFRREIETELTDRYCKIRSVRGPARAGIWLSRELVCLRPFALRRLAARIGGRILLGWEGRTMSGFTNDVTYAARGLGRRPLTAALLITLVAVSVGVTTAVYSVVDGVLLRPLPYPDSDRIVHVWQTRRDWAEADNPQLRAFARRFPASLPTLEDWQDADLGFEALGAYAGRELRLGDAADGGQITPVEGLAVTSGLFEVLGIEATLGRVLTLDDDEQGASRVVVLGHALWRDGFGSAPDVVGTDVVLDGVPYTVVGVTAAGAGLPGRTPDAWIALPPEDHERARSSQFLAALAKLRPDVPLEGAADRLTDVQRSLEVMYPDAQAETGGRLVTLHEEVVGNVRTTVWFLFAAVALVITIAVVNIANVLLISGLSREREMAVRAALGAGPHRLVRLAWMEAFVVVGLGGLLGLALAEISVPALLGVLPPGVPRLEQVALDGRVLAFGLALTAVTILVAGSLPALKIARARPSGSLGAAPAVAGGGLAATRLRSGLVTVEVALAFVLMVGATLLGTSFANLMAEDPGFAPEGLVSFEATPDEDETSEAERLAFLRMVREELEALPGVAVTATNQVPFSGSTSSSTFGIEREDAPPEAFSVLRSVVLDGYFDVMRIPLVAGRPLAGSDGPDSPLVTVVNTAFANAAWPGEDPVGRRLRTGPDAPWITVVGVVGDVRHQGPGFAPEPKLYLPAWQSDRHPESWVLRADGELGGVIEVARQRIATVSPATPVTDVELVAENMRSALALPRFRAVFVVGLASVAVVLALIGVYGVVAYTVTQTRRQIGIRMALGAAASTVVGGVVRRGVMPAAAGVAIGMSMYLYVAGTLEEFLHEVAPADPVLLGGLAILLLGFTALAAYVPSRTAARVDPAAVLGSD